MSKKFLTIRSTQSLSINIFLHRFPGMRNAMYLKRIKVFFNLKSTSSQIYTHQRRRLKFVVENVKEETLTEANRLSSFLYTNSEPNFIWATYYSVCNTSEFLWPSCIVCPTWPSPANLGALIRYVLIVIAPTEINNFRTQVTICNFVVAVVICNTVCLIFILLGEFSPILFCSRSRYFKKFCNDFC